MVVKLKKPSSQNECQTWAASRKDSNIYPKACLEGVLGPAATRTEPNAKPMVKYLNREDI